MILGVVYDGKCIDNARESALGLEISLRRNHLQIGCAVCAAASIVRGMPSFGNDKMTHCVQACMVSLRCGPICGVCASFGTEIVQIIENCFGAKHDVSWEDVLANLEGVKCSLSFAHILPPLWWLVSPEGLCTKCCAKKLGLTA